MFDDAFRDAVLNLDNDTTLNTAFVRGKETETGLGKISTIWFGA
jgi:hypothetical protein